QIAARDKRVWQTVLPYIDGDLTCKGGARNLSEGSKIDRMILPQTLAPDAIELRHRGPDVATTGEFDPVSLSIVEADGFDPLESVKRPGETHGGVLSAGEQDEGSFRVAHASFSPIAPRKLQASPVLSRYTVTRARPRQAPETLRQIHAEMFSIV